MSSLDGSTQQNAAMVEESTAAARSLASSADELAETVSRFELKGSSSAGNGFSAQAHRPVTEMRSMPRTVRSAGNLAVVEDVDDWSNF